VGYTWLSPRIDPEIEQFPIPLPHEALYGWNLYVLPEERRSGIGSALTSARLQHSQALGYRLGWRAIDAGNRGSVGTVRNTGGEGTRIVGRLRYVRVLGWARGRMVPEGQGSG
jgi:GNAT superfamily N-acetyltransferase